MPAVELDEVFVKDISDDALELSAASAQGVTAPTSGCCCWGTYANV